MLTKLTRAADVEVLPLASDTALYAAQEAAAQALPDDDLRVVAAMTMLEGEATSPPADEQRASLRAATSAAIARGVIGRYWITSDVDVLLDVPDGITHAHIQALTETEVRRAKARAGAYPRRGQRVYLAAHATAEARDRSAESFAEALDAAVDALPEADRNAMWAFELWAAERDAQLVAACLMKLTDKGTQGDPADVLGLARCPRQGYPVPSLYRVCEEGASIVAEVAQHHRNLTRLGKAAKPSSPSSPGQSESQPAPPAAPGIASDAGETKAG